MEVTECSGRPVAVEERKKEHDETCSKVLTKVRSPERHTGRRDERVSQLHV
jgi:hypothetical protein